MESKCFKYVLIIDCQYALASDFTKKDKLNFTKSLGKIIVLINTFSQMKNTQLLLLVIYYFLCGISGLYNFGAWVLSFEATSYGAQGKSLALCSGISSGSTELKEST